MDSKSIDLAYRALGGPYLYSLALSKGVGIPSMMLDANDILCHGGPSDVVTVLVDQLVTERWDAFENPCFEPSARFENILIKLLCKKDPRWKILKSKLKRGLYGSCLRGMVADNPRGFENLPGEAHNALSRCGWEYMTQSQRVIFRKEITCMKVALDMDGIEQNFNEHLFLAAFGKPGGSLLNPVGHVLDLGVRKKVTIKIPEIYSFHPRHIWITRQWITGEVPDLNPKDFAKLREAIMEMFPIKDIRPDNLLWDKGEGCYWITDPGIPARKPY